MSKLNNRNNWLINNPTAKFNKQNLIEQYQFYLLDRCISIFDIDNLPETISKRDFLKTLYINGYACIPYEKIKGNFYLLWGGLGGLLNAYYEPTQIIISNPYLDYFKTLDINKDCALIRCDSFYMGLMPLINKYATLLAEIDLSFRVNTINTRYINTFVADNINLQKSFDKYQENIENGDKTTLLIGKPMLDNLKNVFTPSNNSNIKELIELKQYLVGSFYQEIGVNANYNMKREALNSAESSLNDSALIPLIQDILNSIQIGLDTFNNKIGTNIKIKFSELWRATFERATNANIKTLETEEITNENTTIERGEDNED